MAHLIFRIPTYDRFMHRNDRFYRISLLATNGIGVKTLTRILGYCSVNQIELKEFWVKSSHWGRVGFNVRQVESIKDFKVRFTPRSYFNFLLEKNIRVILDDDKNYPDLLKHIDDRPKALFYKGDVTSIGSLPIAVVGTRRATAYGKMATDKIVSELANRKASIISGFMYGIDTYAHQSALKNKAVTVGVLGYGFDHIYPASHKKLFLKMLDEGGVFVSEFAPHVSVQPGNFPLRNRIVAGISWGVVVIEAGKKSGSHITASLAGDYGRGVFAVPGSITNPYSEGTKDLINYGACLVGSGDEVLDELGLLNSFPEDTLKIDDMNLGKFEKETCHKLKSQTMTVDQMSKDLGKSVSELTACLNILELKGIVKREGEVWLFVA